MMWPLTLQKKDVKEHVVVKLFYAERSIVRKSHVLLSSENQSSETVGNGVKKSLGFKELVWIGMMIIGINI